MSLVLDASAALELVLARPRRASIADVLQESDWVFAPSLFVYEVTNALWKYHRLAGTIKSTELQVALEQAIALANEFIAASALCAEALRLACEVDCPAYDAAYLAAAKSRGAMIVTLDRRLIASAQRAGNTDSEALTQALTAPPARPATRRFSMT